MKQWENAVVFYLGGMLYVLLELLWRGWSHGSMFLVGGICFLLLGAIRRRFYSAPLLVQAVLGAGAITGVELVSGLIINGWLGLRVWDYSRMPYNLFGQVCLTYFFLWIWVSMAGETLAQWLRKGIAGRVESEEWR